MVFDDSAGRCYPNHVDDDRVEWIHTGKIESRLADALVETRLGVPSEDRMWIAMHPSAGIAVYLAAVADRVARANDMAAVTDRPQAYGALNGWDVATLARVLLDIDDDEDDDVPAARPPAQVAALYAALAIQAVVPAGLADVPVGKIVHARRTLGRVRRVRDAPERARWPVLRAGTHRGRGHPPRAPRSPGGTRPAPPRRRPGKGLRRIGLRPARAVLGRKSLALPAVASAAAVGAGLPVIARQAGMAATQSTTSTIQARQAAEQVRRSAAGYLLWTEPGTHYSHNNRTDPSYVPPRLPAAHIPAADGA